MTAIVNALTGHRMIERLTLTGTHTLIDKSEVLISIVLAYYGFVLFPGSPEPSRLGLVALAVVGGERLWAATAFVFGLLEVGGLAAAWFGVRAPARTMRLMLLAAQTAWWTAYAAALAFTGATMSPAIYGAAAIMCAMNYRRVYLNGHAWTQP